MNREEYLYFLFQAIDCRIAETKCELNSAFINGLCDTPNPFYKSNEPYKVVYRSKPIQGIVLELVTINKDY